MPISKEKRVLYPVDWKQISKRIRDEAGNKCEKCGLSNGALVIRNPADPDDFISTDSWEWVTLAHLDEYQGKMVKVVLTVHHIDANPANCADDNLIALCQRCHLKADAEYHAANAKETRRKKLDAQLKANGQKSLFDN